MKTQSKRSQKDTPVVPTSRAAKLVSQWRKTKQPIVVRINDDLLVEVGDDRSVHLLAHLVERLDSIAAVRDGLDDVEAGREISFEEFQAKARAKHGLPD